MVMYFVGADIANVVNESALRAASTTARRVSRNHLEYALDRVIAGERLHSFRSSLAVE